MLKKTIKFKLASFLILFLAFSLAALKLRHSKPETREPASPAVFNNDLASIRDNLPLIVKEKGVVKTVSFITEALNQKQISISNCHSLLHLVGHQAYSYYAWDLEKLKIPASNACYSAYMHGVEAQIVWENNEPTEILERFCALVRKEQPQTLCYHGAGHAFMEITNDPQRALRLCDKIKELDLTNCYGGVFSEFGNRVTGYDGDTGLRIPGKPLVNFAYKHALDFCLGFEPKYQPACARQLVKINFDFQNINDSLNLCLRPQYGAILRDVCVQVSTTFYSEREIEEHGSIAIPEKFYQFPRYLKKSFIQGGAFAVNNYKESVGSKIAVKFCENFSEAKDEKLCAAAINK